MVLMIAHGPCVTHRLHRHANSPQANRWARCYKSDHDCLIKVQLVNISKERRPDLICGKGMTSMSYYVGKGEVESLFVLSVL